MMCRLTPFVFLAIAHASQILPRDLISTDGCTPCSPSGATGVDSPTVGDDLQSLYVDLLASVKDIHFRKRWTDANLKARTDDLCCAATLDCVNLQNFNVPMCYDKFTTNYAFADGTFGSLTTGEYNDHDGSKANLLTGDYTNSTGATGNIYSDNPSAKPNTATLSIPPQWTGTGVGSAIPATAIASYGPVTQGAGLTITTPTVLPASTVYKIVSGQTEAVTTIPPRTITGSTVIYTDSGVASTTSNPGSANAQSSAPSASSSKGAAASTSMNSGSLSFSIISALMYAIYAL